ncbi:hypothetical protein Acr_00g0014730 [Actinidia rufa]|uniref:Uncharacterized protein n=1 Tax=Actinidia rufa TaxID=165716 RepID=A0A7J0DC83_9ERIC|nr:hypothetical protein Acr_00g0014730 [Actinidia rufa]
MSLTSSMEPRRVISIKLAQNCYLLAHGEVLPPHLWASRCLPRPSASSHLDNRAQPMANTSQLLAAANPPSPAAPPIPDAERSHRSRRSGDHSQNHSTGRERRERCRSPSLPPPGEKGVSLRQNLALQNKANKYIAVEELAEAKRRRQGKDDSKRKEPDNRRSDYRDGARNKRCSRKSSMRNSSNGPEKIKTDPSRRNRSKYCEFHRNHGYNMEDCFQLKEQIADLIKKEFLRKYVSNCQPPISPKRRYGNNRPTAGDIWVIHGGFGSGGCTSSSRKRHVRNAQGRAEEEIYNLSSPTVKVHLPITFNNDDLRGLHLPHDDALIVAAVIANFDVQRILVDNRSSTDRHLIHLSF